MLQNYAINTELDVPIYRQLADVIQAAIRKGELKKGDRLSTVQELSEALSLARGTVKRAYDELERSGMIRKVQGRGTFVCWHPVDPASRKEQAMAAIDAMLDSLEEMGLSAPEVQIFLNLKLRERAEKEAFLKVAVVECNPESITAMTDQLRSLPQVELYTFLVDSLQQYPYKLAEDFDLVVTTAAHAEYIEGILPPEGRLARVALRPDRESLSRIIRLAPGTRVGILAYSLRYGRLLQETCREYTEDVILREPMLLEDAVPANFFAGVDAVLLPAGWEKYCAAATLDGLKGFAGERIECCYEMDEGSLLYLRIKLQRLLESKRI